MGKHKKSKYAAKLDQRQRDANTAAREAAKKGGYASISSDFIPVSRPISFFPGDQVPIEDYVKKVAAEKAARGQGRKPRPERPELPTYNFVKANFSFVTPAFSGVEHDMIELAGHEFPAVAIATDTGHTYFHVSNTNKGWEIERHFTGGHRHRHPVTVTLKPDSFNEEGMFAQLENWAREQKAKGASLSFYHMSSHPMAKMVNPKMNKPAPAPAPHRSERAKEWGRVAETANTVKPQEQILFITPAFAKAQYGSISILGRNLYSNGYSEQEHARTYLMVVKVAPRSWAEDPSWEIRRCLDTDSAFEVAKIRFLQDEVTQKQIEDALSAWVQRQRNKDRFETTRHSRQYPQATMIADNLGKAEARQNPYQHLVTPAFRDIEGESFTLFGKTFQAAVTDGLNMATYFSAITMGGDRWEIYCTADGFTGQGKNLPVIVNLSREDIISELAGWVREQEYGNKASYTYHARYYPLVEVIRADSDGFKAPFLKAEKEKPDLRGLSYI